MKRFTLYLCSVAGAALLVMAGCADKNSQEACLYETTLNLDNGSYDAVLASPCVNDMQAGAAWFGKAGFDIESVVNRMIDANSTSGTGTTQSDLNIYMTALISKVDENTFTYLDNAKARYTLVTQTTPSVSNSNKDAQFYMSLVDTMKGLSLVKIAIDGDGDGALSSCDINGNGKADEVDAAACALKAASNISTGTTLTCTGASYVVAPVDMTVSNLSGTPTYTYVYSGLEITLSGTGTATCPAVYKNLLYKDTSAVPADYWVATTLPGENCTGGGQNWPCPLESNVDFVGTVDTVLTSAIDSLSSSITTTANTDVQQSINDIKAQNCCTAPLQPGENPSDPATCVCSSSELATYLQTI